MKKLSAHQTALFDSLTKLQQKTALGVLAGLTQRQAYKKAGGSAKNEGSMDALASRCLSNVKVKEFIRSVRHEEANHAIMSRDEAMVRLSNIARAGINHIGELTPEGLVMHENIPIEVQECIENFSAYDGKVTVKLKSGTEAIKQLRAMEAWDLAPSNEQPEDPIDERTDVLEVARRTLFTLTQASRKVKEIG